jgi:hypothetical protein
MPDSDTKEPYPPANIQGDALDIPQQPSQPGPERVETILPGDGSMPRVEYTGGTGQPEGTVMQSGKIVESAEDYRRLDSGADPAMTPTGPSDVAPQSPDGSLSVDHGAETETPEETAKVVPLGINQSMGADTISSSSMGIPSEAPLSVPGQLPGALEIAQQTSPEKQEITPEMVEEALKTVNELIQQGQKVIDGLSALSTDLRNMANKLG